MPIETLQKALSRLHGTRPIELSPDETFVVCRRGARGWRGEETISLGDLESAPSTTVSTVLALPWPSGGVRRGGEVLEMVSPSEQYDFRDGLTWITARVIAYAPGLQTFYALNLREDAKDPARLTVYAVEHDGSDVRVEAPLGAFLRSLSPEREPKTSAKPKRKPSIEHVADVDVSTDGPTFDEGLLVAHDDAFALRRGTQIIVGREQHQATFVTRAVALTADTRVGALALGRDLIVAATPGNPQRHGAVRVYAWGDELGDVVQLAIPDGVSPRWFGSGGVAVRGDTLAVGVPFAGEPEPGCVILYRRGTDRRWSVDEVVPAPPLQVDATMASEVSPARRSFGERVVFAGDAMAVVGDKILWIFENGIPVFDSFAGAPREGVVSANAMQSLAGDRGRVVVGIPSDAVKSTGADAAPGPDTIVPGVGAAIVYERAEAWHQARCIKPRKALAQTRLGVWVAAAGGRVLAATLGGKSRIAGGVVVGTRAGRWDYLAELEQWQSNELVLSNVALGHSRIFQYRPDLNVVRVFALPA